MSSPNSDLLTCKICNKQDSTVKKCSKCKEAFYCSQTCQKADWPAHKLTCGGPWWAATKYRKQQDGSIHEGKLELVTWPGKGEGYDMGWGAVVVEEAEDFKRKFEEEMGGDEKKLFEYWPQAFRWTCCGVSADMEWGCDHHGSGSKPCTCDFCKMGKPLTEKIYKDRIKSQHGMGLKLRRGPDPRSYNHLAAGVNASARSILGMDT